MKNIFRNYKNFNDPQKISINFKVAIKQAWAKPALSAKFAPGL
jgi:hypothetical protein